MRTWKEQIRNVKKSKNSTPTPALPKGQNLGSFKYMLYCLIAWTKCLFLHLFVTIFKQLGALLMHQLTSMGDSQVCFAFLFLFRCKHVVFPFGWVPFTIYIHGSWNIAKQYGIKIEVLLGILKEQFENLIGTDKEQMNPRSWPPGPKREKIKHPQFSHWLHEISVFKNVFASPTFFFFFFAMSQFNWSIRKKIETMD